jgi:hypothetical protein
LEHCDCCEKRTTALFAVVDDVNDDDDVFGLLSHVLDVVKLLLLLLSLNVLMLRDDEQRSISL